MNAKLLSAVTIRSSKKRKVLNDLLEQKYIDLITTYDRMRLKEGVEANFAEHLEKLDALFEADHNWDNASTIEQMLAPMYNEVELDIEIRLNMVEADKRLSTEGAQFFNSEYEVLRSDDSEDERINGKLNLLCNLYKKLQISYDLEEQKKYMLSSIRFSTCVAFFISISMFFLFANLPLLDNIVGLTVTDRVEFIIAAVSSGWMGACFSMLLRIKGNLRQQSLSELAAINRLDNLISRSLIGMVSGLLIFYAFLGEFLQGALFPSLGFLEAGEFASNVAQWNRDKAHAMLIFWCFIAGFSEKMVPDLLSKAEQKATESVS